MAVWKEVQLFPSGSVTPGNIRTAKDAYQFAWVDGRANSPARRVVIDQAGVIIPTTIGIAKPIERAEFTSAVFNTDDDKGTAIKKGKILLVCYTYKNKQNDESNPSPITVLDTIQYQTKGSWLLDGVYYPHPVNTADYVYTQEMVGSIESFILSIPITADLVDKVNVYVAEADYAESVIPPSAFRLTTSKNVPTGAETVDVLISAVPSITTANYDNDLAPKGDDITLIDGTTFIANAVNTLGLSETAQAIWSITLTNPNPQNYINRFHRIDLFDDGGAKPAGLTDYLVGLDWDDGQLDYIRLFDTDLTTPLDVYYYPIDSIVKIHETKTATGVSATDQVQTRMLALIRIPIAYAHADKTIYLVRFNDAVTLEGRFTELVLTGASTNQMNVADFYADIVTLNPLRDENVMVATKHGLDAILKAQLLGGDNPYNNYETDYPSSNIANSNFDIAVEELQLSVTKDGNLAIYDELSLYDPSPGDPTPLLTDTVKLLQRPLATYESTGDIRQKGYYYGWYNIKVLGSAYTHDMVALAFNTSKADTLKVIFNESSTHKFLSVQFAIDGGATTTETPTELNLTDQSVDVSNGDSCFVLLSWDQTINNAEHSGSTLKVKAAIYCNGYYGVKELTFPDCYINDTKPYNISVRNSLTHQLYPSYYALRFDNYIDDDYQILNLARFMPFYELDGIGAYKEFAANDAGTPGLSFSNSNVAIDTLTIDNAGTPGRIQWGGYGAMPDLNEYNINDLISRILPVKSFMPTDEHNTILIWTEQDVYRLSLLGDSADSCTVIKEFNNLGLTNADGVTETRVGIAWLSQSGLILMAQSGMQNVSKGIMTFDANSKLIYDHVNDWLWVRGATNTYIYQVAEQVWWKYTHTNQPDEFLTSIDDEEGWIDYSDNIMYKQSSEYSSGAHRTLIKTKAYRIVNKLGRIKLISNAFTGAYTYLVRLFGKWITGGQSVSSTYTAEYNALTSAPNTKSDYAQIELTGVDGVVGIQTEDEVNK